MGNSDRPEAYRVGAWTVDPLARTVTRPGGTSHTLPPRALQVLTLLARNRGEIVHRDTLIDAVWDGNFLVGDKGLSQAIWQLRRAFDDAHPGRIIETVPRKGYRLLAPEENGAATRRYGKYAKLAVGASLGGLALIAAQWIGSGGSPNASEIRAPRALVASNHPEVYPDISPDGKRVLFHRREAEQYDLYIRDVGSGTDSALTRTPGADETGAVFAPNGDRVAYARTRGNRCTIVIRDDDGRERALAEDCRPDSWNALDWHPNDVHLVYTAQDGKGVPGFVEIDTTSGAARTLYRAPNGTSRPITPRYAPDGRRIAFILQGQDQQVSLALLPLEGGEPTPVGAAGAVPASLAWSSDGEALWLSGHDERHFQLLKLDLDSGSLQRFPLEDVRSLRLRRDSGTGIERLAFHRSALDADIWAVPGDVASPFRLAASPELDWMPLAMDRGIYFVSDRDGFHQLWRQADGPPQKVTNQTSVGTFTSLTADARGRVTALWVGPGGRQLIRIDPSGEHIDAIPLAARVAKVVSDRDGSHLFSLQPGERHWALWRSPAQDPTEFVSLELDGLTDLAAAKQGVFALTAEPDSRVIHWEDGNTRVVVPDAEHIVQGLWAAHGDTLVSVEPDQGRIRHYDLALGRWKAIEPLEKDWFILPGLAIGEQQGLLLARHRGRDYDIHWGEVFPR